MRRSRACSESADRLGRTNSGSSGPPGKPRAVRAVSHVSREATVARGSGTSLVLPPLAVLTRQNGMLGPTVDLTDADGAHLLGPGPGGGEERHEGDSRSGHHMR